MQHGGTSLLSEMLHYSGICMNRGNNWGTVPKKIREQYNYPDYPLIDPRRFYEDVIFQKIMSKIKREISEEIFNSEILYNLQQNLIIRVNEAIKQGTKYYEQIIEWINYRNELDQVWGYKSPVSIGIIVTLLILNKLRNPYIICIHRNLLASAKGYSRKKEPIEKVKNLISNTILWNEICNYLYTHREIPCMHISYENLLINRGEFLQVINFLGLSKNKNVFSLVDKKKDHSNEC